jgi:hypothetical protein
MIDSYRKKFTQLLSFKYNSLIIIGKFNAVFLAVFTRYRQCDGTWPEIKLPNTGIAKFHDKSPRQTPTVATGLIRFGGA